jgi:hypothetical protein
MATIYPEMTISIWLHDLEPVYASDSIELDETDVTFAIADRYGTIVADVDDAVLVGSSFRLAPDEPGRYSVLARATNGTSVGRFVKSFYVSAVTDETP